MSVAAEGLRRHVLQFFLVAFIPFPELGFSLGLALSRVDQPVFQISFCWQRELPNQFSVRCRGEPAALPRIIFLMAWWL